MDSGPRFALGALLLLATEVLVWTTVVYVVRRRTRAEPAWSWPQALGRVFYLGALVTAVSVVPGVGRPAAAVVALVGVKRLSRLDVLSALLLALAVGGSVFVLAAVLINLLQVDLIGLRE